MMAASDKIADSPDFSVADRFHPCCHRENCNFPIVIGDKIAFYNSGVWHRSCYEADKKQEFFSTKWIMEKFIGLTEKEIEDIKYFQKKLSSNPENPWVKNRIQLLYDSHERYQLEKEFIEIDRKADCDIEQIKLRSLERKKLYKHQLQPKPRSFKNKVIWTIMATTIMTSLIALLW